jgi:hypothetical protein
MFWQNISVVTPIFQTLNHHRLTSMVVIKMNHRIRLAQEPVQRVFPIPQIKITFCLALELHDFANLLHRQVEAVLAQRAQLLPDISNGRFGGEFQTVVDCQTHAQKYSRSGGEYFRWERSAQR